MEGFLTIGYCFHHCFQEILWEDKALTEGHKVMMKDPNSLPLGKTLARVGIPLATLFQFANILMHSTWGSHRSLRQ